MFGMLKNVINSGRYIRKDMEETLDVFLLFKKITREQYVKLVELMDLRELTEEV